MEQSRVLMGDASVDDPPRSAWEEHIVATDPQHGCWLWTGLYRKSCNKETPILHHGGSRVAARVAVASGHDLCRFTDNVAIFMSCSNNRCVSPHHMRISRRLARIRPDKSPAHGTKRTHASMTQTDDGDESVSVTSGVDEPSPVPKRARLVPELDHGILTESVARDADTFTIPLKPLAYGGE